MGCKGKECVAGDKVDVLACCSANAGAKCSSVPASAQKTFCGKDKMINPLSAKKLCTGTPCSLGKLEDVKVCCKPAPVTTTKKKNSSTPGTTGSAQTNFVCASAVLLALSQLI